MSEIQKWFERKFDLSFPVELYPNVLARLRGAPARLEELVRTVPKEVLTRKPGDGWSAQEHAGHLLDLEPLWLARVDDYLAGVETLTAADLSNRKTHEARHNTHPMKDSGRLPQDALDTCWHVSSSWSLISTHAPLCIHG